MRRFVGNMLLLGGFGGVSKMTQESQLNLGDEDLLLRLTATEDSFVERKTWADSSDWLKTAVAFANSCPIGYPGVLFIGVRNDGTPEGIKQGQNLETSQKKLTDKIKEACHPSILFPKYFTRMEKSFWPF
jgi:predicted HTH transcriptional regulator